MNVVSGTTVLAMSFQLALQSLTEHSGACDASSTQQGEDLLSTETDVSRGRSGRTRSGAVPKDRLNPPSGDSQKPVLNQDSARAAAREKLEKR